MFCITGEHFVTRMQAGFVQFNYKGGITVRNGEKLPRCFCFILYDAICVRIHDGIFYSLFIYVHDLIH